MPFDESLATRIRDAPARTKNIEEKKMFGCIVGDNYSSPLATIRIPVLSSEGWGRNGRRA
jgi:hypothetical protein